MKALILAAGYGKRLRPLTNNVPKCLVKIGKKSLLQIWLEKLEKQGIKEFLINTHYKSEKVERFIKKSKFAKKVKLVYEKKILGTGGTLYKNLDFFQGEDGLVLHCDNYTSFSVKSFLQKHLKRPKKTLISLLTFKTNKVKSSVIIKKNKNNIVEKIYEKKSKYYGNLANGAFYVFTKKMLNNIYKQKKTPKDIVKDILMKNLGKIYAIQTNSFFIDVGDLESLKIARRVHKNGQ